MVIVNSPQEVSSIIESLECNFSLRKLLTIAHQSWRVITQTIILKKLNVSMLLTYEIRRIAFLWKEQDVLKEYIWGLEKCIISGVRTAVWCLDFCMENRQKQQCFAKVLNMPGSKGSHGYCKTILNEYRSENNLKICFFWKLPKNSGSAKLYTAKVSYFKYRYHKPQKNLSEINQRHKSP